MAVIKLEDFGAMIPVRGPTLLPQSAATYSQNTWLYHGELSGFGTPIPIYTMQNPSNLFVYRIPGPTTPADGFTGSTWMEFLDQYTNVVKAPVVLDQYSRYYYFSPSAVPQYNTLANIQASTPGFLLGIPAPTSAPTLTITGSSATNLVSRAYVYTWVSAYGEESPPSPPVLTTNSVNNTWQVNIPAIGAVATNRNIAYINIYRTIANASGTSSFFFVAQVAIGTASYVDSLLDTSISGNLQLASTTWTPPPNNLQGVLTLPNGMLVGWDASNNVWFCEPYRPHAWPTEYVVSLDYPIVGLGLIGTMLVVATEGNPYVATGTTPGTMAFSKIDIKAPCVSRRSIVSAAEGVYYAAASGLVLVGLNGAQIVTNSVLARQDWATASPQLFMSARYSSAYVAFVQYGSLVGGTIIDGIHPPNTPAYDGSTGSDANNIDGIHAQWVPNADQGDNGVLIDGTSQKVEFTRLKYTGLVSNVIQDEWSGEVFLLSGGVVYQWDAEAQTSQLPYIWRSKLLQFPYKEEFVAAKIFFNIPSWIPFTPGVRNTSQTQTFDPTSQYLLLKVWADGVLRLVREVQVSGELILIPAGTRSDMWQIEIDGIVTVLNIQMATSVKELSKV